MRQDHAPSADRALPAPHAARTAYTRGLRLLELSAFLAFLASEAWLFLRVWPFRHEVGWLVGPLALGGCLFADFVSGLFHWAGDTWASPTTPFVGPVFVRTFREHHTDPLAITRHDFIEVNGGNCLIMLPTIAATHLIDLSTGHPFRVGAALFFGIFFLWIFATNQIHMWSHLEDRPDWVSWLQRMRLILPADHHAVHHVAPHLENYCITVGWLNEPLRRIGFFRRAERLITWLTGYPPRASEAGRMPDGVPVDAP